MADGAVTLPDGRIPTPELVRALLSPYIPGLPEGVIPIRWGVPEEGQFVMLGGGIPVKAANVTHPKWTTGYCLVVKLLDGYHVGYNRTTDRSEVLKSECRDLSFVLTVKSAQEEVDARKTLSELGYTCLSPSPTP